jgi:hypothetical protein
MIRARRIEASERRGPMKHEPVFFAEIQGDRGGTIGLQVLFFVDEAIVQ